MLDSTSGAVRGLRAALLVAVAVGLGAGGHSLASDHAPNPAMLSLVALVVAPIMVLISDRVWSRARVLAALAATQVLTHLALLAGAHRAPAALSPASGLHDTLSNVSGTGLSGADHVGQLGHGALTQVATGSSFAADLVSSLTPGMLVGHLLAAMACAVLLARLDDAMAAVISLFLPLIRTTPAAWVASSSSIDCTVAAPVASATHSPRRPRGPPVLLGGFAPG